jgi:hypothetical protein
MRPSRLRISCCRHCGCGLGNEVPKILFSIGYSGHRLRFIRRRLLKRSGEWTPFMERIDPKEFMVVENKLRESLSDTSDLVIYDATGQSIRSSIALIRQIGKEYRLEIFDRYPLGSQQAQRKALALPTDIADRLRSVMELTLTTQIYPSTGKAINYLTQADAGRCIWVALRIDKSRSIAGVVSLDRCLVGHESTLPFLDVIWRIILLAETDESERTVLIKLDLAISDLRQSYPPKG